MAAEELRRHDAECASLTATIRASLDIRPVTQSTLEAASAKLHSYMDALEAMKTPMRSQELSSDEMEHWKHRRGVLKVEYEKLAAEFETLELIEVKDGTNPNTANTATNGNVEMTDEERRLMSGRAPLPVVQDRLLELASVPKTPVAEQRTFEPVPLRNPPNSNSKPKRPFQPVNSGNETTEASGRPPNEAPKASGSGPSAVTTISVGHNGNGKHAGAGGSNGQYNGTDIKEPAPASGCCIIL